MKKDSFENQWKARLQDAEADAPVGLWEKLEGELDAEQAMESHIQNTVRNASISPSAEVWGRIEKELDKEKERKFVFFWLNRRTAAALAAMLLIALSFGLYQSGLDNNPQTNKSEVITHNKLDIHSEQLNSQEAISASNERSQVKTSPSLAKLSTKPTYQVALESEFLPNASLKSEEIDQKTQVKPEEKNLAMDLALMAGKTFRKFGTSITLKRNKLPFETPDEFTRDNRSFLQRSWFGLISGISPFYPNIKINNFERAALVSASDVPRSSFAFNNVKEPTDGGKRETFAIPLSQPYNEVKRGTAMNFGLDYGKRIGKFFSLEGGLRYTAGQSVLASNVYSYNEYTGSVRSFLESYYIRQDNTVFDNTVISTRAYIDNDYKFFNIPVQLGFYIPVTKKMEAAVTAGFSGDFIINNVLDNIPEGGSKLTSRNSAYHAVNLSGIGGVKMNYMIRDNWQVSLGSNIQQTLTTGVDKSEGFTFKPRYIGLNTSINYRFN